MTSDSQVPEMINLDTEFVRQQFPALHEPELRDWHHFENAGGSYMCTQVVTRLQRFFRQRKVQPYGAADPSRLGGEEMDDARTRLAGLLGVETDELSFGPSTSQNSYVLANAFGAMLEPGDAVIVTNQDHEANSGSWRRLERFGIEIREWGIDGNTGMLELPALERLLDRRVRLVCFPHCSNIIGAINPVREIVGMARDIGALSCVDGVSFAPHGLPWIPDLEADIYMFSAYKTYGPHQGIMVIRNGLADRLENQGHYFLAGNPVKKLTPAGPDHAQIAACAGIADYMDCLGNHHRLPDNNPESRSRGLHDLLRKHEIRLSKTLLDYLADKQAIRICGPANPVCRVPTISIVHNRPACELASELADDGIIAGAGDFYAPRCLEAMGLDPQKGVLRLSFVHYTSMEEIRLLIKALERVL